MRSYEFCTDIDENGKETYVFLETIDSIKSKIGRSPVSVNIDRAVDTNLRYTAEMPDIISSYRALKSRVNGAREGKLDELFAEVKRFLTKARAGEQSVEGLQSEIRKLESRVNKLYVEDEKRIRWMEQRYWNGMKEQNARAKLYEYIGPEAVKFKKPVHPWIAEVGDGEENDWEETMEKMEEEDDFLMVGDGEGGSKSDDSVNHGLGISVQHEVGEGVDTSLELNGRRSGRVVEDKNLKRKASEDHEKMSAVEGCIVDDEIVGFVDIGEEHGQQ
jgi:hypothetical protein